VSTVKKAFKLYQVRRTLALLVAITSNQYVAIKSLSDRLTDAAAAEYGMVAARKQEVLLSSYIAIMEQI